MKQVGNQFYIQNQVSVQVRDQAGYQVWSQVLNQVRLQVENQVWNVWNQAGSQVPR